MEDSNWITLLGAIMVGLIVNPSIAELIKRPRLILKSQLVRKTYIHSKYSIAFLVNIFFKEIKM